MRRDLHRGSRARLPSRPERPAHDDEHPGHRSRRHLRHTLHARIGRHGCDRGMPHLRADPRGIPDADAEDGFQPRLGHDAGGISGRHRRFPHRPLCRGGDAADPRRVDRAVPRPRREVHARAEVRLRRDAPRRVHAGGLRPEAGRRIQECRGASLRRLAAELRSLGRAVLDRERARVRRAGRLS